jgi:hypothetical protein
MKGAREGRCPVGAKLMSPILEPLADGKLPEDAESPHRKKSDDVSGGSALGI